MKNIIAQCAKFRTIRNASLSLLGQISLGSKRRVESEDGAWTVNRVRFRESEP